jgi:glycosyltransferase involved in cell wall biosynthesis
MRNYKILRVSHFYILSAITPVIKKYPDFDKLSYAGQKSILLKEKVYNCAAFSNAMQKIGNESVDIFYDLEKMQKRWAAENDLEYDEATWKEEILLEQIKAEKPDVIFFQHNIPFKLDVISSLKTLVPSIKLIVLHFAHLGENAWPGYADLILLGTPGLVHEFQKAGLKPRLFYHYFDEGICSLISEKPNEEKLPITFVGSSGFGFGPLHADRYWTLHKLLKETPMEAWVWEPRIPNLFETIKNKKFLRDKCIQFILSWPNFFLKNLKMNVFVPATVRNLADDASKMKVHYGEFVVPKMRLQDLYKSKCYSGLSGLDYYHVMANSKISFHKHGVPSKKPGDKEFGNIGAIRLFEATGFGSCLLTDTGPNMPDLFDEGKEIVTYKTTDEAKDRISYLLENEKERLSIAIAGRKRTLRDHTANNRCIQLHDWINNKI